ncbi:MAG: M2 family metallopeptidase [Thermoanaerobaculia bacterium]|nr:M2 family metallopeptidase [Thermoanaerobaculia bacterium]
MLTRKPSQSGVAAVRALRLLPLALLALSFLLPPAVFAAEPAAKPAAATVAEAEKFMAEAEARLLKLFIARDRAQWIAATYITEDTETLAAQANELVIAASMELAQRATRFAGLKLPAALERKMGLLKSSQVLPAPADAAKREELTQLAAELEGMYGRGKYCPEGKAGDDCLDLGELSDILSSSRDPKQLEMAWTGWHSISRPMRSKYQRFVELANEGAAELGYRNLGELWRSKYDMAPDAFVAELDRLWGQVKPLYDSLHCYVRARLTETYGKELVPPGKPIPAQLLGNMWAQQWGSIYDIVKPTNVVDTGYDLTARLQAKGVDELGMVRYGEGFFSSLAFEKLPATFWTRSMFLKPRDRDVVCHASAWDLDQKDDLRIKMCIQITEDDFSTIHHELGHNYYQRAYNTQPTLFLDSANDGFHEALGDTVALSVTPAYLKTLGLIDSEPPAEADVALLLQKALDKVAFLPFGLIIDKWRWQVFSGEVAPGNYNQAWWDLKRKYQGVAPPAARSEADFDPGAKFHVPGNTPYMRYFLADVLQFQFHRALCQTAGYSPEKSGPLHRCSIYGSEKAGEKLGAMMALGASQPWPDALEALTGQRQMDASAILDYFAPLKTWLDAQNEGQVCGW